MHENYNQVINKLNVNEQEFIKNIPHYRDDDFYQFFSFCSSLFETELNIFEPIFELGLLYVEQIADSDPFHWRLLVKGPENTVYSQGFFYYTIDLPNYFPTWKPEVRFINKIYHLNVSPTNGHISARFFNNWKSKTNMKYVILFCCIFLALDQNPDEPYDREMAKEYRDNRPEFDRKAREWTNKYASYSKIPDKFFQLITLKKFAEMEKTLEKLKNSSQNNNNSNINNLNNLNSINLMNANQNNYGNFNNFNNNNYNFISLHFMSIDSSINFSMCCRTDELFSEIETKLYKKVPKLQSCKFVYFLVNGIGDIARPRSLRDNNIIEDGTKVIINYG